MAESRKSNSPSASTPAGGTPVLVPTGQYLGKAGLKLAKPVILVGAKADCHLHLLSSTVSQHHAVILTCSDGVIVRDLASRTKTFVNGKAVHERLLVDGDELKIGRFSFNFDANGFEPVPEIPVAEFQIVAEGSDAPIALNKHVLVIGRRSTCDISLVEESASTTHALLLRMEGKWVVRDLSSRTGTRVNGGAVRVKELVAGDVIHTGETDLRFERVETTTVETATDDLALSDGGLPINDDLLALAGDPLTEATGSEVPRPVLPVEPAPIAASEIDVADFLTEPVTEVPELEVISPVPVVETPAVKELAALDLEFPTAPVSLPPRQENVASEPVEETATEAPAASDVESLVSEPILVEAPAETPDSAEPEVIELAPHDDAPDAASILPQVLPEPIVTEAERIEAPQRVDEETPPVPVDTRRPRRGWRGMGTDRADVETTPVEPAADEQIDVAERVSLNGVETSPPTPPPILPPVVKARGKRKTVKTDAADVSTKSKPKPRGKSKPPAVAVPIAPVPKPVPEPALPEPSTAAQDVTDKIVVEDSTAASEIPPLAEDDLQALLAPPVEPTSATALPDIITSADEVEPDIEDRTPALDVGDSVVEDRASTAFSFEEPVLSPDESIGVGHLHVFTDALPPQSPERPSAAPPERIAEVPTTEEDAFDLIVNAGSDETPAVPDDAVVVPLERSIDGQTSEVEPLQVELESEVIEPAAPGKGSEQLEASDGPETVKNESDQVVSPDVGSDFAPGPSVEEALAGKPVLDFNSEAPVPISDLDEIDFSSLDSTLEKADLHGLEDDTLPPLASLDELEAEEAATDALTSEEPATLGANAAADDEVLNELHSPTDITGGDFAIDSPDLTTEPAADDAATAQPSEKQEFAGELVNDPFEVVESAAPELDSVTELETIFDEPAAPARPVPADADVGVEIISDSDSSNELDVALDAGDLTDDSLTEVQEETKLTDERPDELSDSSLGRALNELDEGLAGPLVEVTRDQETVAPPTAPAAESQHLVDSTDTPAVAVNTGVDDSISSGLEVPQASDIPLPETIDATVITEKPVVETASVGPTIDFELADLEAVPSLDLTSDEPLEDLDLSAFGVEQGDQSLVHLDALPVASVELAEAPPVVEASASPDVVAVEETYAPVVSAVVPAEPADVDESSIPAPTASVDVAPPGSIAAGMTAFVLPAPTLDDIPPQLLGFDDDENLPPRAIAPRPAAPLPSADEGFDPFATFSANTEHFLGGMGIDLRPNVEAAVPPAGFGHVSVSFDAKPSGFGTPKSDAPSFKAPPDESDILDDDGGAGSTDTPSPLAGRSIQASPASTNVPLPRPARSRGLPFSQQSGPIAADRTVPSSGPGYNAAAKPATPFEGLALGSLGTGGAVRQTDVFFNMPSNGAGSAHGPGVQTPESGDAASTDPIPYAGTRLANAPVGKDISTAPGLPVAPPRGMTESSVGSPRRKRKVGVRELVALLLLTLALLTAAVWWLVPFKSLVEASVIYDNFEAMGDGDRVWFVENQAKIIGTDTTRDAAKKKLAALSPETSAGFLNDPIEYAKLTFPGNLKWPTDKPGTLVLSLRGGEATAQAARLSALVNAVYDANLPFVTDAAGVKKSVEQLRTAIDRSVRDKEDLERQIREAQQQRNLAPDPVRVRALADDVTKLEGEASAAARKVRDLQAEVDRLTAAPGTGPGGAGGNDVAPTDPELIKMRQELSDLNAKLAASKEAAGKQTVEARQALDSALDAFNKRVATAQQFMGASPELMRYVTAAQTMQDATRKITNELIQSQQESVVQITETRRTLDDINTKRRAERIKNDVELKQMQENMAFSQRKLNAATGSADSQLVDPKQLDELRGSIEILKAQIQSRQEQVGEDKYDREATAALESLIVQSQKRMDDNRKKYEGILDGLAKEFAAAAPAVEKLSAEQKQLFETLNTQAADVSAARKQYSDALGTSSTDTQKEIEKTASDVKARIEARAIELAEATKKTTASRAEQERVRLVGQKQKELGGAKIAGAQAEVALKKAKDDLWDAQKLAEQASTANDRTTEYTSKLGEITQQLKLQRGAFDAKQKEAARSVAPRKPMAADVRILENADPRPMILLLGVALTCVVYSALIARASAAAHKLAAPVAVPVNGNGTSHNTNGHAAHEEEKSEAHETTSV